MIEFSKYQGVGNDFVVVELGSVPDDELPSLAVRLCERRFSVGADGLLALGALPNRSADDRIPRLAFRMFNPDGSEDMCGNGLRCAILWAFRQRILAGDTGTLLLHCFDHVRTGTLNAADADGAHATITVEMGLPIFDPERIPFSGPVDRTYPSPRAVVTVGSDAIELYLVNTGSAHAVIFGDKPPTEEAFFGLSPVIENLSWFPERTSIMWTSPAGRARYDVRIWERAVGETLGCGTGATAIAATAWATGRVEVDKPVTIVSKGGELRCSPQGKRGISMAGPASWIFDGVAAG